MIAALALLGAAPVWRDVSLPSPAGQYLHALPAFLIGVYAGTWRQTAARSYAYALGALLIGVVCLLVVIKEPGVGSTYAAGLLLAIPILFRHSKMPASRLIGQLGSLTFGVYLIHPLVLVFTSHFLGVNGTMLTVTVLISFAAIWVGKALIPARLSRYLF